MAAPQTGQELPPAITMLENAARPNKGKGQARPGVIDLKFWHVQTSASLPTRAARSGCYFGIRIADFGFPAPKVMGKDNPKSEFRDPRLKIMS